MELPQPGPTDQRAIWPDSPDSSETLDSGGPQGRRLPSKTPPSTPSTTSPSPAPNALPIQPGPGPSQSVPSTSNKVASATTNPAGPTPSGPRPVPRARKQQGPPEVEAHKDEILGLYSTTTNRNIRDTLADKYNIRITEKQLKRVLRLWRAYKNDRGVRKATITRKHERPARLPRRRRQPRVPLREPSLEDSDEDMENVEEIPRSSPEFSSFDENVDWSIEANFASGSDSAPSPTLSLEIERRSSPASPILITSPIPGHMYIRTLAGQFPFPTADQIPIRQALKDLRNEPPFKTMFFGQPSQGFPDCRDRIVNLFKEVVQRFPASYKLNECASDNHWAVYRTLRNESEQRFRQGILIAQDHGDKEFIEEVLDTSIVPMLKDMDLLALLGLVCTFSSLTDHNIIFALFYHLRMKAHLVVEQHRGTFVKLIDCLRDIIQYYGWDVFAFNAELRGVLSSLPTFVQKTLGPRSLVGVHIIFLLNMGDISLLLEQSLEDEATRDDIFYQLGTRYLMAGKLFFSTGIYDPLTRFQVQQCYTLAKLLQNKLEKESVPDDDWRFQDLYFYLGRVGIWKAQCDNRQMIMEGCVGANPDAKPAVGLLEECIQYCMRCKSDGPESPIVLQALTKLREMFASAREYFNAEMVTLRIQCREQKVAQRKREVRG